MTTSTRDPGSRVPAACGWCALAASLALGVPGGVSGVQAQSGQMAAAPAGAAQPAAGVENGRRLYHEYFCYACHGTVGQGGSAGVRLVPDPPGPPRIRYLRNPAGQMPAYTSKVISDKDLADIFLYLRSLPPPPRVADIPLLRDVP